LQRTSAFIPEFKIDAVEETSLGSVQDCEEVADFGTIGEDPVSVNREWLIEADFPPLGYAIREFGRHLEGTIRGEAARHFRLALTHERIV